MPGWRGIGEWHCPRAAGHREMSWVGEWHCWTEMSWVGGWRGMSWVDALTVNCYLHVIAGFLCS